MLRHCRPTFAGAFVLLSLPLALAAAPRLAVARSMPAAEDELVVCPQGTAKANARSLLSHGGAVTRTEIPQLDLIVVKAPPGRRRALERDLRASRLFRFVEPNYLARVDDVPDDPLYAQQWGLSAVSAPLAWDLTRGQGATVAVVDTGVELTHPDLLGRLVPGFNAVDDNGNPSDDHGHGTRMAGIVGATGFNGIGVIGMAPDVQVMPIKVLGSSGSGTYSDIAQGVAYAVDHGADVVSLSLGGDAPSATLANAVAYAVDHGVVVVAAAGNLGVQIPSYPAAYTDALAVGAVDATDTRASFSSYGTWLDLVAPGVGITTTNWGETYGSSSGTSPATPFVAGTAALMRAVNPTLQPSQVASLLTMTAEDLGAPGFDVLHGWGRLDAARAVNEAEILAQTPDAAAPTVVLVSPGDGDAVEGDVPLAVSAVDDVGVARVEYELDGVVIASSTTSPFAATWNASTTTSGPHLLGATAYDGSGNRGLAPAVTVDVSGLDVTCGVPDSPCLPGGGKAEMDCLAEWVIADGEVIHPIGKKRPTVTCTDGAACDQDGLADGACRFQVGICFSVTDSRLAACDPDQDLTQFKLAAPGLRSRRKDPVDAANADTLVAAVTALSAGPSEGKCLSGPRRLICGDHADCDSDAGMSDGVCGLREVQLAGTMGGAERCTSLQSVRVPLRQGRSGLRKGNKRFKALSFGPKVGRRRPKDADAFRLVCLPPS